MDIDSPPETHLQIIQTFYTFTCTFEGASLFVEMQDLAPFLEQAPQEHLIQEAFGNSYHILAKPASQGAHVSAATISQSLDRNLGILVSAFKNTTTPEVFFALVTRILVAIPPEVIIKASYIP